MTLGGLKDFIEFRDGSVVVKDKKGVRDAMDRLVCDAVFEPGDEKRKALFLLITELAKGCGAVPASIQGLYEEMGRNYPGFTVPAVNIRGMTYDVARAMFRKALPLRSLKQPAPSVKLAYHAQYAIALKKGRRIAKTFEGLYQTWLTFGGYGETPKHYIITVVDLFRRSALEIAKRFVAQGRLDSPAQIFDLTIADIDRAGIDPSLNLRGLAQEHKVLINKMRKSKLTARILVSRGKIFYPPRKAATDGELSGVPISPGVVQGRVKVLQFANEKQLLPGEILVARATDPGWTPLFINAKGIILEIRRRLTTWCGGGA